MSDKLKQGRRKLQQETGMPYQAICNYQAQGKSDDEIRRIAAEYRARNKGQS